MKNIKIYNRIFKVFDAHKLKSLLNNLFLQKNVIDPS